jgi:hypothetical protein
LGGFAVTLPLVLSSLDLVLKDILINEIMQLNNKSRKYGLILSAEDAREIIEARNRVLRSYGRVELDSGVTKKLILSFCDSPFINQEDYAIIINDLQEIYYYLKNETEDLIGDDELLQIMKELFNTSCGGSRELLAGRELDVLVRDMKYKSLLEEFLGEGIE